MLQDQLQSHEGLAEFELKRANLAQAQFHYEKALGILNTLQQQDSNLISKSRAFEEKINDLNTFRNTLHRGDSLFRNDDLAGAYEAYLTAIPFEFGRDTLIDIFSDLESYFLANFFKTRNRKYEDFPTILKSSATANQFLGEIKKAYKRTRQTLRHSRNGSVTFEDQELDDYVDNTYRKSFFRRLQIYAGSYGIWGSQAKRATFINVDNNSFVLNSANPPIWAATTLGLILELTPRLEIASDVSLNNCGFAEHEAETYFASSGFQHYRDGIDCTSPGFSNVGGLRLYGLFTVFDTKHLKLFGLNRPLKFQIMAGYENSFQDPFLTIQFNKIEFDFRQPDEPVSRFQELSGNNKVLLQIANGQSSSIITFEDEPYNQNVFGGIRLAIRPLRKVPQLGFYLEMIRKWSLSSSLPRGYVNGVEINHIVSEIIANESDESLRQYLTDHYEEHWPEQMFIGFNPRQFLYAWSMGLGASFNF